MKTGVVKISLEIYDIIKEKCPEKQDQVDVLLLLARIGKAQKKILFVKETLEV